MLIEFHRTAECACQPLQQTRVTLGIGRQALVEGHRGILEYTPERVVVSFGREKLSLIRFYPTKPIGSSTTPVINTAGTVSVTYPLKGTETVETWTTTGITSSIQAFTIDYYETPSPIPTGHPVDGQSTTWPNSPQKWYTVLPNTTQGSYTVEVAVVSNDVKTAIVPAEYMQWKPGYEYTYKFKITETGGITMDIIQVAINDWTNRQSSQHTVYNW